MDDKKMNKDYKLESLNIRVVENGFVVRCEKVLTDKAKAKQRIEESGNSKGDSVKIAHMEHYKSEERVADSVEDVLERIKEILKGTDKEGAFNEAFEEDNEEDGKDGK